MTGEKVFVLGIDGADIHVLEKAMAERNLPNIEKIRDEGALGKLKSCHPPVTVPAWMCMFTGKTPGDIGTFHFQKFNTDKEEFQPFDFTEVYGNYLWDIGIKTNLAFVPGITPPYEIEGRVLEGKPGEKQFRTYPSKLKKNITTAEDRNALDKDFESQIKRAKEFFNTRKKVVHRSIENYDQELTIAVYDPADKVAHFCETEEELYDTYEYLDEEVGYFIEKADEADATLFIVSDHGSEKFERAFFINTWLKENGFQQWGENESKITQSLARKIGYKLIDTGLKPIASKAYNILQSTPLSVNPTKSGSPADNIIWENSEGIGYLMKSLPASGIMLNEDNLGDELDNVTKNIISKLEEEEDILWAKRREDLYEGEKVQRLPHIIIRSKDKVRMAAPLYETTSMNFKKFGHGYDGIIGVYGKNSGENEVEGKIQDIAPTILHALGKPIPEDMRGKVISSAFKETGEIKRTQHSIDKSTLTIEEESDIQNRLEELGYMKK